MFHRLGANLAANHRFARPGTRDDGNPAMPLVDLGVEIVNQLPLVRAQGGFRWRSVTCEFRR